MPETTGAEQSPGAVHHIDLLAVADELLTALPGRSRQTRSLARESGVSTMMIAMEAGDELQEHSAAGVVTVQCLTGLVTLRAGDVPFELRPGQMVMMQPNVAHDVQAVAQSVILLTVAATGT